ncbi:MAG TPA: hypothetical protein VGQ82_03385 [Chthoniobacterales bacterium]|nr:hypothetical protein [Chthoniobacterales bacterium]
MAELVRRSRSETAAHLTLKRAAALWAQGQGYSICTAEVSLPNCRYRADVAAYRPAKKDTGVTAIFECKQAWPDLKRDNCYTPATRERLQTVTKRRQILERALRVHYPTLRTGDSLFPEWEGHDFSAIKHRRYTQVMRELGALSRHLHSGTKFERLLRYRCANLLFLVLPNELFREAEAPLGWGVLLAHENSLHLARKPTWQDSPPELRLRFLERIAACANQHANRILGITYEDVAEEKKHAAASGC